MDFFNKRKKDPNAEMSFIDHLEELRWHLIRAVIAICIGAIVVFIYVKEIVDKVLLAPAHDDFVSYQWFCKAGRALRLGDTLCMQGVKVSFLSTEMTGQFISSFTIAFVGGFIIAFPYVFWELWRFILCQRLIIKTSEKMLFIYFSVLFVSTFYFLFLSLRSIPFAHCADVAPDGGSRSRLPAALHARKTPGPQRAVLRQQHTKQLHSAIRSW